STTTTAILPSTHLHYSTFYTSTATTAILPSTHLQLFYLLHIYSYYTYSQRETVLEQNGFEIQSFFLNLSSPSFSLCQLIGRGRYGSVFCCSLDERQVAVKVFSSANRQNFLNECSIYCVPLLEHDNIAHFIAADERLGAEGRVEYLLVMEYYPHGSLHRYLGLQTGDWMSSCRLAHSITRGLAYLHTELLKGAKKPLLSRKNIRDRLIFCKRYRDWTAEDWSKVIFSESPFRLFGASGKKLVLRRRGERYHQSCVMPTVKHLETIHVWGCFSAKGVGSLTILPKNTAMNKEWYQHILRENRMGPKSGPDPASSYIEEQEGMAKNTQSDASSALIGRTRDGGVAGERNRNSINYERQQAAHARLPGSPSAGTSSALTTMTFISESSQGHDPNPNLHLTLTQEDLETTKLDPREVDKNLKESSDENLMEHSQKQFCSPDLLSPASSSLLFPFIKMAGEASPPALFPLPKQQNLPKRPSSLLLRTKPPKKDSSSLRFKFGRHGKSNLRQVEGGAKTNAVSNVTAVSEPHRVSATNNLLVLRDLSVNGRASVSLPAGGASSTVELTLTQSTNPQSSEDGQLGLITASPDEHQPLLSRETGQPDVHTSNARPNNNNSNSNGLVLGEGEGESEALLRQPKGGRRPERPNSLDLSFTTRDLVSLGEQSTLTGTGEKIKKRVKTPYSLKRWRPATWVISTDTGGSEVNNNRGEGQARPKSSSAVYLTSEPNRTGTTITRQDWDYNHQ
uniref:receptor protein serine/threonine kinase n=1 Tax=Hucho hucho TaxID=62062 RepID=A0A4W5PM06_9TELE